jgi:hypothetical protein
MPPGKKSTSGSKNSSSLGNQRKKSISPFHGLVFDPVDASFLVIAFGAFLFAFGFTFKKIFEQWW